MNKKASYFVSLVMPVHNQSKLVVSVVKELHEIFIANFTHYEIIIVDDGSYDDTEKQVSALLPVLPCIRYIQLSRSFGIETAIAAGLDTAIGDVVVTLEPNKDPFKELPELIERCKKMNGILFGVMVNPPKEGFFQKLGRNLFYSIQKKVLSFTPPPKYASRFTVMSRSALNAILAIKDKNRYIRVFGSQIGFANETFYYKLVNREKEPKSRGFFEQLAEGMQILVMNSSRPLRYASYIGLFASFFNLLYMVYVLIINLISEEVVPGWTTTSIQNSVMWFCMFLILSIMLEYIGRLLTETRDRPNYYVLNEKASNVLILDEQRRNITSETD